MAMPSTSISTRPRSRIGSRPVGSRTRPSRRWRGSSAGRSRSTRCGPTPPRLSRKSLACLSRSFRPSRAWSSGSNRFMQSSLPVADRPRRPEWMKVRAPSADSQYFDVRKLIHGQGLNTICEEARCPNISECWGRGTATFQILGDICTRACRYCYVHSGRPQHPPDPLEPLRLANTAAQMGLDHVVVTSVDRDDLPDKGASHFAATIRALKHKAPDVSVEVLTPDFLDFEEKALRIVLAERPEVFDHNIETVRRL